MVISACKAGINRQDRRISGCEFMSWDQRFFDPITLPDGRKLVTLREAARYITTLPKVEHDADEWQVAMRALLLVAEHDGPTMFGSDRHDAGAQSASAEGGGCTAPQAGQGLQGRSIARKARGLDRRRAALDGRHGSTKSEGRRRFMGSAIYYELVSLMTLTAM